MASADVMRKRFWDLANARDGILSQSSAPRQEREELQAQIADLERRMAPLNQRIREIEAPLYDINQERAMLARALGGATGPRPGA